ncbi:unnamed protein product [Alopecurus aequalis]
MAMLRSAIRLALRPSAPASRFLGNVGRRNSASSITTRRNFYSSSMYEFTKEDFTNWNGMEFLFGSFAIAIGLVFYHNLDRYGKRSRYNTANYEKKSTSDTGHCGQDEEEKGIV